MKNKKWILFIIGVLIVLNISFLVYQIFLKGSDEKETETKVLDTIKNYNYNLEDRDTTLYKEEFKALKTNLTSGDINYDDYAKSITKLYIIDLYTLDNKLNKYDVGGKEFVNSNALDNYIVKVEDTLYKYIEDNTYKQRNQDLPTVKSINITDFKTTAYSLNNISYESYEVTLTWAYNKTNTYDTSAKIIIIKDNNKLSIVEEARVE